MTSISEAREALAKYKAENPHVDWEHNEAYVITRQDTGEIERFGIMSKKALDNLREDPK